MKNVRKTTSLAVIALVCLPGGVFGQDQSSFRERSYTRTVAGEWQGARLADGQPDVQGHWSNTIGTSKCPSGSAPRTMVRTARWR